MTTLIKNKWRFSSCGPQWLSWILHLLFLVILISLFYVYLPVISSPADKYLLRKGELKTVKTTKEWLKVDSQYTELELLSSSGLKVQLLVRRPGNQAGPLPVAIILGGVGTGRNACRLIPRIQHVICVSLSYPYQGKKVRSGPDFFSNLRAIQRTVKDTPPAILLVIDYLLSKPFIDKEQVELLGVSFGSYFISIPAVLDKRVTRLWVAYGSAEPMKVIGHNLMKDSDSMFLKSLFGHLVGYAIGAQHVDPSKWIGKVSPRPVILVNAEHDNTFPESSVKVLHDSVAKPREIFWTKGTHISPNQKDVIRQLSTIVMSRIETDYKKRTKRQRKE